MNYPRMTAIDFWTSVSSEEAARELLWKAKFDGASFKCSTCGGSDFYQHKSRPEVRTCRTCLKQTRLRAGSMFENTKLPLLLWLRAIYMVMQGKRGVSALEVKRTLELKSYTTTWLMLMKIRRALRKRDDTYKLKNVIELDGARFGRRRTGNQSPVLVAVESKEFKDEKGRSHPHAGFAKVMVAEEDKWSSQEFVDKNIAQNSMLNVDASLSFRNLRGVDVEWQDMNGDHRKLSEWLPWVHRFISNAKTWIIGTHHGVHAKYLSHYLAEYTYRFNRRHDPNSLFSRTISACYLSPPITLHALSG